MPTCAEPGCGVWRPERVLPKWAAPNWVAGIRFNGGWYCSRRCVEGAVRAGLNVADDAATPSASLPPLRLGAQLRHLGVVSDANLKTGLEGQAASGRRLGAELIHRGLATRDAVLRALAAQNNVRYIASFDATRAVNAPGGLAVGTVRALGLVPFDARAARQTLLVACTAPVPLGAIRALRTLTGWIAEPYLVTDESWAAAMAVYRPAATAATPVAADGHDAVTVSGIAAAAARIADTAEAARVVTMRLARMD